MKKMKFAALVALAGIGAAFSWTSARADDGPYNDIRAGSYTVFYHLHADDLSGPYVPPGVNFEAVDLETLYLGYIRRLPYNLQVELAMGYPPLAKIKGTFPPVLGALNGDVIASSRWISPSVLLEYNFFDEKAPIRPFVGVGVNYTTFYARDSTAEGNAAAGGPTRLSLSASVGPAITAGWTAHFDPRWHVTMSYSAAQVKSNLVANTDGVLRTSRLSFGPQALIIALGYSF